MQGLGSHLKVTQGNSPHKHLKKKEKAYDHLNIYRIKTFENI